MYKRISKYVLAADGTRLAVDLYLPETEEKVPVLFQISVGERRPRAGDVRANAHFEETLRQYEFFLEHGYAICVLEPRGIGASFGRSEGFWCPQDGKDMAVVIDSIASEDWCNGNAGMYGGSNVGASQHFAAMNRPKALRCIVPCDCSADFYYQNFPNGVSILPDMKRAGQEPHLGIPVDEDIAADYPLAHAAMEEHRENLGFLEQYAGDMHRDEVNPVISYAPNMEIPLWEHMNEVRFSDIVSYAYGAFYEPGCTNKIFEYRSFGGRLLLGPWRHVEVYRHPGDLPEQNFPWEEDHLEFFEKHLKGIENDAMNRPPVRYYTTGDEQPWHYSADFPLDDQTNPCLRLTPEGKIVDLSGADTVPKGRISYKVREDIRIFETMGRMDRRITKDLREENEKCVTFATEPLEKDLELTGFPVLDLYVTSTYKDGVFLALLEEELPDGTCRMLTDGGIRGRSAKLSRHEILDPLGVPYHSSLKKDDIELSDTVPTQLSFHLEACSYVIRKGSRLRVALYCGGSFTNQPAGMPADVTVTFYFGGVCDAFLKLPVIRPNVTAFEKEDEAVYVYKKAVYRRKADKWQAFPCLQVYPDGNRTLFVTEAFTAAREYCGNKAVLSLIEGGDERFFAETSLPDRMTFTETSTEIVKVRDAQEQKRRAARGELREVTYKNLYVATVPVAKGVYGNMNPKLQSTMDLFTDLIVPEGDGPFPCIVCIHGFGGDNHFFEPTTGEYLARGYAVASIDYRLMPPNVWPSSGEDARACIRYLKAHAAELKLDPDRFGVIGGSMGGQLTAMIAACNGKAEVEGSIGGNTHVNCSVKAAVALFAPTDLLSFGDDCLLHWPDAPEKKAYGDGEYVGCAAFTGYLGPGKGIGELKKHIGETDTEEAHYLALAREASPVNHVTESSAPLCLVHGIADCGIMVPMNQSIRMFEAYTRAGVKSLVLLNNNGFYGADPEVRKAMTDFLTSRV